MPGFNAKQAANNARNGNTVAVMLGDQIIAFAQTLGHQIPFGTEQLYGIGTSKPQEVQQLRMSPAFTLDTFALTEAGVTLLQGGLNLDYILAGNAFDMHVFDGLTNTVLFSYVGAKAQNLSQNVPTNAIVRTTYSFLALDVLDPQGNSIMDDHQNAISVASAGVSIAGAVGSNLGASP